MCTFEIVVENGAIVVLATVIAYNRIFLIFTVRANFCQKWRDQRYISGTMVGTRKKIK